MKVIALTEESTTLVMVCCTECGAVKVTDRKSRKNWIDNSVTPPIWKSQCVGNCDGATQHEFLEENVEPRREAGRFKDVTPPESDML